MDYYIDTKTQELFAYEKGTDSSNIREGLTPCTVRPSQHHSYDAVTGKWVEDTAAAQQAALASLRAERNSKLQSTDVYMIADFPITAAKLTKLKAARKALRDAMVASDPTLAVADAIAAVDALKL